MSPNFPAPVPQASPNASEQRQNLSDTVIRQYGSQLKALVDKNCRDAIDREKIFQYAVCRRNDFYYRGNQHLVPTFSGNGEVVDFKPVNSQMLLASNQQNAKQRVIYDYVINNFRGDLRKLVGVLGQKAPNCKARPSWASDDTGCRRSNIATDCASYLHSQWDTDSANRYLVLSLGKNGTSFIYTPFVSDGDRYGTRQEPVWGTQPQKVSPDGYHCMFCGTVTPGDQQNPPSRCSNPACLAPLGPTDFVPGETQDIPAIIDQKEYSNGAVELSIHSPYDVTTPFFVKDLEHCPWLWLDYEDDAASLVSQFNSPELLEDLRRENMQSEYNGSSSATLGKLAREQASSPTGYSTFNRPNRWAYARFWIRPAMYLYLLRDGQNSPDDVGTLKKQFPRGMKLSFVNKKLVKVEHERLDEVWAVVKPETSEYIYADPLFNDYIQLCDIANDGANIAIQTLETSVPATIYDPQILDRNKVRQGFQVNEFIPAVPGANLQNGFFRVPTGELKEDQIQFIKDMIATGRELLGLLPAIWGGDAVPNETAEAARRRLNQALMVLSTTWNEMRNGWAKAYRNGVRQLARYSLGRLVSTQGDAESVNVRELGDIEELLQGGWEMECDQAIPMNWTQLRDFVQSMFTLAPEMADMMGFTDPENAQKINEGVGIPGWKLKGTEEREAVHDLIGRLMKEQPIQGPDGPSPSIPLDFTVTWNPNSMVKLIHDWLMSEEGRSAEGSPGCDNVIAAGNAALKFMAPPPMPPGGRPPGGLAGPPPGTSAPTLPESLPGANAPTQPEQPLPPLPQQTSLLNSPPQGSVQ
jgi:hypothetical protein